MARKRKRQSAAKKQQEVEEERGEREERGDSEERRVTEVTMDDRLAKLNKLKALRLQSAKLNRSDAHEELVRSKEDPRLSAKIERKRIEAEELQIQQQTAKEGLDFERIRNLEYTVDDVERWNAKVELKEAKKDKGFTDFTQMAARKYDRMIADFKPNNTGGGGDKPSQEAVQRLAQTIEKQDQRRAGFSRRRAFNEDDEVTYINDRNMHFNKKIARSFDKYTAEIKANFERGTAL